MYSGVPQNVNDLSVVWYAEMRKATSKPKQVRTRVQQPRVTRQGRMIRTYPEVAQLRVASECQQNVLWF